MSRIAWLPILLAGSGLTAMGWEKIVSRTLPLAADGRLVIETERGSLRVSGWDNAQVEVWARIEDESFFLRDSGAVNETDIKFDATPGVVRVKSDYSRLRRQGWGLVGFLGLTLERPAVHYRIRMPRTARLRIKDYRSETDVSDLKSDLEMETYRGSVEVRGLEGAIQFKSYRGQAWFKMVNLAGNSRLETFRGGITLTLPRDRGFHVDTDLGRHASWSSDFRVPARTESRYIKNFRGAVNGGGPRLLVKTERGTVRLRRS